MAKSKAGLMLFLFFPVMVCLFSLYHSGSAYEFSAEKITYAISPVGIAEYSDDGLVELNGKKLRLITFKTSFAGFSDLEKIYSDPQTLLPLRVERWVSILFRKEHLIEEYSPSDNTLVITKFINNKKVKGYNFKSDGPMHNAITLPFYLRTMPDLKIGWSFVARFPQQFTVTLSSIEEIRVPAGKFKAYHFTSSPEKFEMWISQDENRLPIKIKGLGGHKYALLMKKHSFGEKK